MPRKDLPWLGFALVMLVLTLSFSTGCATPVGVKRVGTREAYHLLTTSVLSAGTPSLHSVQVLSRHDLIEQFDDGHSDC